MWSPDRPYNELPALPPLGEIETKVVLRRCIEARAALAALKQAAELIPNPAMLINTLPLLEAQASSAIENVVTTADALFRHMDAEERADPATREALRYRYALMEAFSERDRPIGTRTAEAVCTRIRGVEMSVRRVPGTKLVDEASGRTIYTPPKGEDLLRGLLSNWERFLNEEDGLDPLVRMAVAHYQFEAIHPFTDGNGRTGRVLNSLYLVQAGLLTLPVLYLSRYVIAHKSDYYRLLLKVTRDRSWQEWLLFMLEAVEHTAQWTLKKIEAIRRLAEETREFVRQARPKVYSHELIDLLFERPYCRIASLDRAGIAKRQTAAVYLRELVAIGVLKERRIGREKLFIHTRLLNLLTRDTNAIVPFE
jgi:Fic family protein